MSGVRTTLWNDVCLDRIWDDACGIEYTGEAGLSEAMATYAHLHGWFVQREIVIPGWGRLDLVLTEPGGSEALAIELKLTLRQAAAVRKAFQQAEGYRRWLKSNPSAFGESARLILSSPTNRTDPDLVSSVNELYPSVSYHSVSEVLGHLTRYPSRDFGIGMRRELAAERLERAQREVQLRQAAIAEMEADLLTWAPAPEPKFEPVQ